MAGCRLGDFRWALYRQGYGGQGLGPKWASWAPQGSPHRSAPAERYGYALLRHIVA